MKTETFIRGTIFSGEVTVINSFPAWIKGSDMEKPKSQLHFDVLDDNGLHLIVVSNSYNLDIVVVNHYDEDEERGARIVKFNRLTLEERQFIIKIIKEAKATYEV